MSIKKIGIIGGGIFGCSIALELIKDGYQVTIIEQDSDIMLRASKNNHNRIHYGYHYPRSLETTRQSIDGLLSFMTYYSEALLFGFQNYYTIAKSGSLTSAIQFKNFCNEAGIGFKSLWPDINLLNKEIIDDSFLVEEPIYDWQILQNIVKQKLSASNVILKLNTSFNECGNSFDFVINCTYSNINQICKLVGVDEIKFRLQDVIIPIFESNIERVGLTVMDGPFCSIMPKGFTKNHFLLYHAKYSIVCDTENSSINIKNNILENIDIIFTDSMKYFPFLKNVKHVDHWRTIRAIPINNNDERLSEIITYKNNPNFITVFSGKVSTAIKIAKQIRHGLQTGVYDSNITI